MARFIARRLVGMLLVLFAISVIVFLIFNVIPTPTPPRGSQVRSARPALIASVTANRLRRVTARSIRDDDEADLHRRPYFVHARRGVDGQIWEGVPATLSLCIGAAVMWLLLGVLFGYLLAMRAGGLTDRALTILALVGISVPVFWLAAILLYYLTFKVALFPSGSYVPLSKDPVDWGYHLVLPWMTLAVLFVGFYSRVLRSNMLDVMNEDYVRTARAKGISERQVRLRHVLRNSMIPIVTLFGLDFGVAIGGGAILTESIFNLQGVGQYAAEAIANLDLPPIMAVTMFAAFFIVLFNALVDIAYAWLDPRIRLEGPAR